MQGFFSNIKLSVQCYVVAPPFTYEGRRYTAYEAQQQMREMERAMRKQKDCCIVADASGDKEAFTAASIKLRRQKDIYEDFCRKADSFTQYERTIVGGYDRHLSGKTGAVTRKTRAFDRAQIRLTDVESSDIIKTAQEKVPLSQLNLYIRPTKQQQHILGSKGWLEESKRLIAKSENPKSFLFNHVDPQKIVDKYAPITKLEYRKGSNYPIQYVICDDYIGKTFDKKAGKYIKTRKVAIVHSSKGVHVYPVIER